MTKYQISKRVASHPFVIAAYHPDSDGVLKADLPDVGPCFNENGCRIFLHNYRERKTGPRFPIAVCGCRLHGGFFTIYPPGFGPYVRRRVAPVDHTGEVIDPAPEAESFSGTYFQSSLDLAIGLRWDAWDSGQDVALTQRRQIERSCQLLAIAISATDDEQATVAATLNVPQLHFRDEQRNIRNNPSLEAKSQSIRALLSRMQLRRVSGRSITSAHHLAGILGAPHFGDQRSRRLTCR